MQSEIPQLEVVTAIPDAEGEDFLAQLLFSQGWSIIHRALDSQSIIEFMQRRSLELRTVIVYTKDFPGFIDQVIPAMSSPTLTLISLDGVPFNSHELMTHIRGQLRAPMVQPETGSVISAPLVERVEARAPLLTPEVNVSNTSGIRRTNRPGAVKVKRRKVIAITGTTGAPGRTKFAKALADELSMDADVLLVDADIRSHGMAHRSNGISKYSVEVVGLDREDRPTRIPDGDETTVVDMGTLPGLAETVSDRRWHGSLTNNILENATQLIYVCKSTPASQGELAGFLREYPLMLNRVPVSYVCVLSGHSRELREWESKFISLTAGEVQYIVRDSQLEPIGSSAGFGKFKVAGPKRKEIAKIALSLT